MDKMLVVVLPNEASAYEARNALATLDQGSRDEGGKAGADSGCSRARGPRRSSGWRPGWPVMTLRPTRRRRCAAADSRAAKDKLRGDGRPPLPGSVRRAGGPHGEAVAVDLRARGGSGLPLRPRPAPRCGVAAAHRRDEATGRGQLRCSLCGELLLVLDAHRPHDLAAKAMLARPPATSSRSAAPSAVRTLRCIVF